MTTINELRKVARSTRSSGPPAPANARRSNKGAAAKSLGDGSQLGESKTNKKPSKKAGKKAAKNAEASEGSEQEDPGATGGEHGSEEEDGPGGAGSSPQADLPTLVSDSAQPVRGKSRKRQLNGEPAEVTGGSDESSEQPAVPTSSSSFYQQYPFHLPLYVPYSDRLLVKAEGAKWWPEDKVWCITETSPATQKLSRKYPGMLMVCINKEEREEAKTAGACWRPESQTWWGSPNIPEHKPFSQVILTNGSYKDREKLKKLGCFWNVHLRLWVTNQRNVENQPELAKFV